MELFKAHRQWASRPPDERFASLEDLYAATRDYASTAVEADVNWQDLRTITRGDDVLLVGKDENPAALTNFAFKQLSTRVGAPADYLGGLPAALAVENLNHGLQNRATNPVHKASLLLHRNGGYLARAVTTDVYSRIWNHEVGARLLEIQAQGWEPARPDIRAGENPAPALYASDHDMFVMLRHSNVSLHVNPSGQAPVWRGVITENSEVGASSLKLTRFLYNAMCGNHIIWGASDVIELKVRHVGHGDRLRESMKRWALTLTAYANESVSDEEATIRTAQRTMIADTKEGVLDKVFGVRSIGIPRKTLEAGYDAVVPDQDGDARTVWGLVQGLTRHSQTIPYADRRKDLDRAAGRILEKVSF